MTDQTLDERVDTLFVQLKDERIKQQISLQALAERIGTTKSNLWKWEEVKGTPSFRNATKWVHALGYHVTINRLGE